MSDTARGALAGASDDSRTRYHESRVRYRAMRRGFRVMQTRGREHKRRKRADIGTYLLIDQATNGVVLAAATLQEIAAFIDARQHQLN